MSLQTARRGSIWATRRRAATSSYTIVQKGGNSVEYGGTTSLSTTLGATPTVGNTLVLAATGAMSPHTVTGPAGWTAGPYQDNYQATGIWTKVAGASESSTITVTFASNHCVVMQVYEIAGLTGSIDKSATCGTLGAGVVNIPSGITATLSQANELAIVAAGFWAGSDTVTAYSNSFVRQDHISSGAQGYCLDVSFLTTASTAAQSCTLTTSVNNDGPAAVIATFPLGQSIGQVISSLYFGNHILGPLETSVNGSGIATLWPSWSPTTLRLWDCYGYDSAKSAYDGIVWKSIATANGVYDWTLFDALLAKHKAKGVTDLIYTFGQTPVWAGGGSGGDQAPSSMQYLTDFATAIANRAVAQGLPIKYWEIWNEPNNGANTWIGTNAQMVSMSQAIYNAVKAVDPTCKVLSPCPQGTTTTWMDGYLAAGGGAYVDIMSFHGYVYAEPEVIITLIANLKTVFATYGQSAKPIWNTEAFDFRATVFDGPMQVRFLAVCYLLQKAKGVDRFYWYAWDANVAHEWAYDTGVDVIGTANAQLYSWMVGATLGTLSLNGTVYQLPLVRSGTTKTAIWDSSGSSSFTTSYTSYGDLAGSSHAISGNSVTIGSTPILLGG